MTADLHGRHDLGDIVGLSYRVYARHFRELLLVALTVVPVQMLIAVIQRRVDDKDTQQAIVALLNIPNALVVMAATAALIVAVNDIAERRAPDFGRSLETAFERFGALLSTNLLGGVLAILSLIALPYFVVRWLFGPQAVMIEGKRNWAALDASSSIVRGYWWRTLGIMLTVVAIALGPMLLASFAVFAPPLVEAVVTSTAFALLLPFLVTAQTLLYYDLRARKVSHVDVDGVPAPEQDVQG